MFVFRSGLRFSFWAPESEEKVILEGEKVNVVYVLAILAAVK